MGLFKCLRGRSAEWTIHYSDFTRVEESNIMFSSFVGIELSILKA